MNDGWWDNNLGNTECFDVPETEEANNEANFSINRTIEYLQQNKDVLVHLENAECIRAYSQKSMVDYSNVLVVTNTSNNNSGLNLNYVNEQLQLVGTWLCANLTNTYPSNCDVDSLVFNDSSWAVRGTSNPNYTALNDTSLGDGEGQCGYWADEMFPVQYCLAQPVPERCGLGVAVSLLIVVIVCNAIKVLYIFWTLARLAGFQPLLAVGDAVVSFLERPDDTTKNLGPIETTISLTQSSSRKLSTPWQNRRRYGFSAATTSRWVGSSTL